PRDLELIVLKLLAKDPAQRFATGEDVVAALDGAPVAPVAPTALAASRVSDAQALTNQIRDAAIAAARTRIETKMARIETKMATRQARHEARRKKEQEHTPAERLRSVRRQLVSYAGTSLFLLGINYMTGTGFWWAIFPILGMGMGL